MCQKKVKRETKGKLKRLNGIKSQMKSKYVCIDDLNFAFEVYKINFGKQHIYNLLNKAISMFCCTFNISTFKHIKLFINFPPYLLSNLIQQQEQEHVNVNAMHAFDDVACVRVSFIRSCTTMFAM